MGFKRGQRCCSTGLLLSFLDLASISILFLSQVIAEGLADALFGQGKVQEAKTVMRAAGLVKKGMQQNMPASYVRWLNKRVAKFLDKKNEMAVLEGEEPAEGRH